jgi:hypothetical protein
MFSGAREDARRPRALFIVVFFVFLVLIIVVNEVAIFPGLFLVILIIFFVRIISNEIQVDRVRLRDLEFGLTLGTTQDLAFLDFVFIDIDFGGTFRATDHGSTLRTVFSKWGHEDRAGHLAAYYIPQGTKSTPVHGGAALNAIVP